MILIAILSVAHAVVWSCDGRYHCFSYAYPLHMYNHSSGLAKTILQGTVKGGRRQGRQKKRWEDNIKEWTDPELAKSQTALEKREKWRKISCG